MELTPYQSEMLGEIAICLREIVDILGRWEERQKKYGFKYAGEEAEEWRKSRFEERRKEVVD